MGYDFFFKLNKFFYLRGSAGQLARPVVGPHGLRVMETGQNELTG